MDIEDFADRVRTRQDFEEFLERLLSDLQDHGEEWGNTSLKEFLEGLRGFARDMAGYYTNRGESLDLAQPTWRVVADLLLAARVYE
ncbi:MAG: hypothetical protein HC897_07800 [Thermoanaerobaculia bacterium]|nr:hypothetical protein [Thermoanaerobaculia bacterium]